MRSTVWSFAVVAALALLLSSPPLVASKRTLREAAPTIPITGDAVELTGEVCEVSESFETILNAGKTQVQSVAASRLI